MPTESCQRHLWLGCRIIGNLIKSQARWWSDWKWRRQMSYGRLNRIKSGLRLQPYLAPTWPIQTPLGGSPNECQQILDQKAQENWLQMGLMFITFYACTTPSGQLVVEVSVFWKFAMSLMLMDIQTWSNCQFVGCAHWWLWRKVSGWGDWDEASVAWIYQRSPKYLESGHWYTLVQVSTDIPKSNFDYWTWWVSNCTGISQPSQMLQMPVGEADEKISVSPLS